jgi:hypothetical protein
MKKLALSLLLTLSVTSCATYISGRTQEVKLTSNPEGAECSYSNERSTGNIRTPGVMALERSKKTLSVTCSVPGYGSATQNVEPGANYWLLANVANFGLGYFYDVYDGSSWDYPKEVHVVIQPTGGVHQGNFMLKDYGNPAIQPRMNVPQMPTPEQAAAAQQQQPVSQAGLMADIMREREMITSEEDVQYTPPSFDKQNQMQQQWQQQGYMQATQQQAPAQQVAPQQQWQPVQPQQPAAAQAAPQQAQPSPYEIYLKQREQQKLQEQYYTAPRQQ